LSRRAYSATFVDAAPATSVEDLLDLVRWRLGSAPVGSADDAFRPPGGQDALGESVRLSRLLESLGEQVQGERNVLLIDEPAPEIGHTLFGRLRDEVWQLPVLWIVGIDSSNRASLMRPPADAFFPVVVELGSLSDDDAVALLRVRAEASGAVAPISDFARLVDLAGGSPRRLLALARDLVINQRSADEILNEDARRRAILDDLGDAATHLFGFLQEHGASSASDEDLLNEMGWTRARAAQVLNSLEEAGLVTGSREKGGRRRLFALARLPE
jgi:hypothetical protein